MSLFVNLAAARRAGGHATVLLVGAAVLHFFTIKEPKTCKEFLIYVGKLHCTRDDQWITVMSFVESPRLLNVRHCVIHVHLHLQRPPRIGSRWIEFVFWYSIVSQMVPLFLPADCRMNLHAWLVRRRFWLSQRSFRVLPCTPACDCGRRSE